MRSGAAAFEGSTRNVGSCAGSSPGCQRSWSAREASPRGRIAQLRVAAAVTRLTRTPTAHFFSLSTATMSTWASYLATGPGPKKRFLVGGNWKCNGSVKQVGDLVSMLNAGGPIPLDVEVVVAPVSCHLSQAIAGLRSEVQVSAQNCADTAKVRFRAVVAKQSTLTPPSPPKSAAPSPARLPRPS